MAWRENLYSRVVAWLKILLPLTALVILSTLFLFSRSIDPTSTIPYADIDLEERARDRQVTAPFLAGATENGDLISFQASYAIPDPAIENRAIAQDVEARIALTSGTLLTFNADTGILDDPKDQAELRGRVIITSTTGYVVRTTQLTTGIREIRAETAGEVAASGPPGEFTAGKMLLRTAEGGKDAQLFFTNGIKLVYLPQNPKE